jgi:hypothetical protein
MAPYVQLKVQDGDPSPLKAAEKTKWLVLRTLLTVVLGDELWALHKFRIV